MRKMKADAAKLKQQEFFESEEDSNKPSEIISALLQSEYGETENNNNNANNNANNINIDSNIKIDGDSDNICKVDASQANQADCYTGSAGNAGQASQGDYYSVNINARSKGVIKGASEEVLSGCKKANRSKQLRAYNVVNEHSTAGMEDDKSQSKESGESFSNLNRLNNSNNSNISNKESDKNESSLTDASSKFFQFTLFDKKDISLKNPNGTEEDEDPVIVAKCEIEDILDSLEALESLTRSAR